MENNKKCIFWVTKETDSDGNEFCQIICYDEKIADDLNNHYLFDEIKSNLILSIRFFLVDFTKIEVVSDILEKLGSCVNIKSDCGYAFVNK